jgi:hypothetical protein
MRIIRPVRLNFFWRNIMSSSRRILIGFFTIGLSILLALTCISHPANPYDPSRTKANIMLESSTDTRSATSIQDSVGKTVRVAVACSVPANLDSVNLKVTSPAGAIEIQQTLPRPTSGDTVWFDVAGLPAGDHTVIVEAFIREGHTVIDSGKITIFTKPGTPSRFALTVNTANGTIAKFPEQAEYDSGTIVALKAHPGTGYHFVNWSGDASGTMDSISITMNSAKNVTAVFAANPRPTYTLIVAATNGTVSKSPDQAQYDSGSTVALKAHPANGYHFLNWTGDASGTSDSIAVPMNGPKNITANFEINAANLFPLTISAANGSVTKTPDQSQYAAGTVVGLRAHPNTGYHFVSWGGDASGTMDSATILVNSPKNATATFAITTYQLTIRAGTGGTISAPSNSTVSVFSGAMTTVTAVANTGYKFSKWTVILGAATIADSNSSSTAVILSSGDAVLQANFSPITYQLTINAGAGGKIAAPSSSPTTVDYGVATPIKATPDSGCKFIKWTIANGSAAVADSNAASTTVTLKTGNAAVLANFRPLCQWTPVNSGLTDKDVAAIAVSGSAIFAGTLDGGDVFMSTDSGLSWKTANTGLPSTWIISLAAGGGKIFAGTPTMGVFISTNNGTSWNAINTGLANKAIYSLALSGSTIFTGTNGGGIFISANDGASWSPANSGLTNLKVLTIAVSGSTIFAGTVGGGAFLSTNGGASWSAAGLPANCSVNSFAVSGGTILAGVEGNGVSLSTNNGTSWNALNAGLPANCTVSSFAVKGSYIFAAVTGRGVFISNNNGASWIPVNTGLTNLNVSAFAISGGSIFVGTTASGLISGTPGSGIFRSPLP